MYEFQASNINDHGKQIELSRLVTMCASGWNLVEARDRFTIFFSTRVPILIRYCHTLEIVLADVILLKALYAHYGARLLYKSPFHQQNINSSHTTLQKWVKYIITKIHQFYVNYQTTGPIILMVLYTWLIIRHIIMMQCMGAMSSGAQSTPTPP